MNSQHYKKSNTQWITLTNDCHLSAFQEKKTMYGACRIVCLSMVLVRRSERCVNICKNIISLFVAC